jgi:hypothetical protein
MAFKFGHLTAMLAVMGTIVATPRPALAGHGCFGCNVVDEHVLGPELIGQNVKWIDHYNVQVVGVDPANETLTFVDRDGVTYRGSARFFYTIESDNERIGGWLAFWGAVGCAATHCLDGKPASSSSSSPPPDDRNIQCHSRCNNQAYGGYNATVNDAQAQRAYCHRSCPDGKPY